MVSSAWELLRRVFTAESIMTPRQELLTWEEGTDRSAVEQLAREWTFDLIPVIRDDRIVAVWSHSERGVPEALAAEWLVSCDTGIPDLLTLFVECQRPGLLVLRGQEVVGIVTPADLNKIPARVYFYHLIGELELALAAPLRREFGDDAKGLLEMLSDGRRREVDQQVEEMTEGDVHVDLVQRLYLSDFLNLIAKRKHLRADLGFSSRKKAEEAFSGLVDLRRRTMHPVRPLLERAPDDVQSLHRRVKRVQELLDRLEGLS